LADLSAVAPSAKATGAEADVAQLAEHVLGKDEVTSSILVIGSILRSAQDTRAASFGWQARFGIGKLSERNGAAVEAAAQ
jgi:hypothetical protein